MAWMLSHGLWFVASVFGLGFVLMYILDDLTFDGSDAAVPHHSVMNPRLPVHSNPRASEPITLNPPSAAPVWAGGIPPTSHHKPGGGILVHPCHPPKLGGEFPERSTYYQREHFLAAWNQYDAIRSVGAQDVLEIGVGHGLLTSILRHMDYHVDTMDIDPLLHPDILGDIRHMPIDDSVYDVVCAFSVLEHLPWGNIPRALGEMRRVSQGWVIISVPYRSVTMSCQIRHHHGWGIRLRLPCVRMRRGSEHYWEMGEDYTIGEFRQLLEAAGLVVERCYHEPLLPVHQIFVCKKGGGG